MGIFGQQLGVKSSLWKILSLRNNNRSYLFKTCIKHAFAMSPCVIPVTKHYSDVRKVDVYSKDAMNVLSVSKECQQGPYYILFRLRWRDGGVREVR